jgi:hypothetical protein
MLDELNSPVVALHFQRLSNSTSTRQQVFGLSGLIRGGSGTALATAAQPATDFAGYPLENGILLQSVRDYFRATDAGAISTLGSVAADSSNPNTAFREAAAHALAAIHTVATLPYLATLFNDPDTILRVEAIGGMGAFANGLAIQTMAGVPSLAYLQFPPTAPYMTATTRANFALGSQAIERDEASYLSFWKQWWSQNKAALGF